MTDNYEPDFTSRATTGLSAPRPRGSLTSATSVEALSRSAPLIEARRSSQRANLDRFAGFAGFAGFIDTSTSSTRIVSA